MPGDDFVDAIGQTLGSCDLMIAVIGPGWLSAADAQGRVRLQDPADFVRLEVAKALERHVRTVPVLVSHAAMPHETELPDPLKPLTRRQAVELSDARWSSDVRELVERIKRATSMTETTAGQPLPAAHAPAEPEHHDFHEAAHAASLPAPAPAEGGSRTRLFAAVGAIVVLAGIGGAVVMKWNATPSPATPQRTEPAAPAPITDKPPAAKEAPAPKEAAAPKEIPAPPKEAAAPPKDIPAPKNTPAPKETVKARDATAAALPPRRTETALKTSPANVAPPVAPVATPASSPAPRNDPAPPVEAKALTPRDRCDSGDVNGCVQLGIGLMNGRDGQPRDERRASMLFQRACDEGNLAGCTHLGMAYAGGTGVPRDDARAVELYQRSCNGGNMVGCDHLGQHYERGMGVRGRDVAQARNLYQRSCDGGAAIGCTDLARVYERGIGVPKDGVRASSLYQKACSGGDQNACTALKWVK